MKDFERDALAVFVLFLAIGYLAGMALMQMVLGATMSMLVYLLWGLYVHREGEEA